MRTDTSSRSTARISRKTKVCDSRGHVLTTYPTVRGLSDPAIRSSPHQRLQKVSGDVHPVRADGFVMGWIIVALQVEQKPLRQRLGSQLPRIEHVDQVALRQQAAAHLLLGAGPGARH